MGAVADEPSEPRWQICSLESTYFDGLTMHKPSSRSGRLYIDKGGQVLYLGKETE